MIQVFAVMWYFHVFKIRENEYGNETPETLSLAHENPLLTIHNAVYDAFDSLLFSMMRLNIDPPHHLRILFGRFSLRGRLSIKLGYG